ncbi:TIR domain-containing protein [Nostoc spongiaeforme FACHB-130]|uniref:TIR domain-containing protein n=1 Tax=Nostoc spongiaeforme FACHB-130 TaxID=1357510 RepID=A0ABR8G5C9_9NOSO|nr:TIR domain-containing protein [Nostoc spongiaeforme]MBD2598453.1 TIR domain-containing protein [Nostoc spongiaeforme FACHB-130]
MTNLERDLKQRPQIFVSYASADSTAAKTIVEGLRSHDLNVCLDADELRPGNDIAESIRATISASAYFLMLFSKHSARSPWMDYEIETVLKELQSRDVTFLPILLEDCDIPPYLAMYQWFDMRNGLEENLEKLTEALRFTPKIDFEKLSPQTFEQLVVDLLQKLGFVSLQSEIQQNNSGIDAVVEFRQKDPFGAETREIYAVETKLYHHARADLQTLRQLAGYAKSNPKINKALLVTNGNLTSVALDWVKDAQKIIGIPIRVISGTELKRLLLQNTDLVSKYFSTSLSNAS